MKKITTLTFVFLLSLGLFAQQQNQPLYLLFEFMKVNDEKGSDYLEVEQFWTEIHKQRVADGNIIGWDLWAMSPGGSEQGSQYFTVTLFSSLEAMLQGFPEGKFNEYLQKAHPNMSDEELGQWMEKTVASRDIAHQVYCKEINTTEGDFDMPIGTLLKFDIMKQIDDNYEKVENDIFKPWHQQLVDNGQKEAWGFIKVLLPAGSQAIGSHMTYSMYSSYKQIAGDMEGGGDGTMDTMTSLAVKQALETRDWRMVEAARLIMKVR